MALEIAHHLQHFVSGFAEPEHQARFGGHVRANLLGIAQHVERPFIASAEPHLPVEAGHCFGVVVEDVGMGIHDDVHGGVRALKIGHKHFYFAAGNAMADGLDGHAEEVGTAIRAIVPIDAGDNGVAQAQSGASFGDAARLIHIDFEWRTLLHGAETAAAGADVAEDHEGGGAAIPAFTDVWAGGTFADGVEMEVADQVF